MAPRDMRDANTKPQRDRFIEKARELGCDEDEGRFNETLKRIVPKEPDDGEPEPV